MVFPIQNFINAVAIGFGIGINAVIAIHLGAGEGDKAGKAASQELLLSAVHGVLLMAVCIPLMPVFIGIFTDVESVTELGVQYSAIAFSFASVIMIWISLVGRYDEGHDDEYALRLHHKHYT